jgi:hypothetical protein
MTKSFPDKTIWFVARNYEEVGFMNGISGISQTNPVSVPHPVQEAGCLVLYPPP